MADKRLRDIIKSGQNLQDADVVIIGFPYDEGVRRNGGRVGAAKGPDAFRTIMLRLCASDSHRGIDLSRLRVVDGGNIAENLGLEEAHSQLEASVVEALKSGAVPFVVGGGNDQSFANARALMRASQRQVAVINVDAHLDVRELKEAKCHSGSPFRQMIEDPLWQQVGGKFVDFGAQGSQCSLEHV